MMIALALFLPSISVNSLLAEMDDLDRLMSPASYTAAQSSSYDPASKSPTQDWFANGDAGKFIRDEGKERVMADLRGPGSVVRIWSANPAGTIRFYFDGETTPRLKAPMGEFLRGKTAPFGDRFAYEASKGCNIYFPFPYSKSLKITAEGDVNGLYYHVGYRTYAPDTVVDTFDPNSSITVPTRKMTTLSPSGSGWKSAASRLSREQTLVLEGSGPGIVRELQVKVDKADAFALRSLVLTTVVDGEKTVIAPVGDFFGTAAGLTPYKSQPMRVLADGTMICAFPMPLRKNIQISLKNTGSNPVQVSMRAKLEKSGSIAPFRFHAQWSYERGRTRPMRDLNILNATGEGRFVGVSLHVENPTPAWWGEGDEKIYVDGESFPSTFGTGTEDYFGYAWCWPEPFQRPYHGQPRVDGPGNFGHTTVYRWQIFDDIPFTKSLKFDLEMWHWADVTATWARTAYWYATPGSKGNFPIKPKMPVTLAAPKPVVGALEGEGLKVLEATGGKHEVQEGFWEISGGKQLWWMDANPGDKLVVEFPVASSGRYELVANLCHAKDYGIHEMRVNGQELVRLDLYADGLGWQKHSLGVVTLEKGVAKLEITCVGANSKALPRRMFGLDYLLLKKATR